MVEIKENQHTRALCEKLTFSCNLFRPADWLPFDTLNSEFLVKFQNNFFFLPEKMCLRQKASDIKMLHSCLFCDTHDVRK